MLRDVTCLSCCPILNLQDWQSLTGNRLCVTLELCVSVCSWSFYQPVFVTVVNQLFLSLLWLDVWCQFWEADFPFECLGMTQIVSTSTRHGWEERGKRCYGQIIHGDSWLTRWWEQGQKRRGGNEWHKNWGPGRWWWGGLERDASSVGK